MNSETVNAIGTWVLRLALVGGIIAGGFTANTEVSGACTAGLILSFFFL